MPKIILPDVAELVEAIEGCVERRLGRRRRLYTGEDLIDDVGLSPDQFDELIDDLERRFAVQIGPESLEHLTVTGALVVRLMRVCSRDAGLEAPDAVAAA